MMGDPRYRDGELKAASKMQFAKWMFADEYGNAEEINALKRNVGRAMRDSLTGKQLTYVKLYYGDGVNMAEISRRFGVCKSTVSRTIKRAEDKIGRELKYASKAILKHTVGPEGIGS